MTSESHLNHDQFGNEPVTLVQPSWDLSTTGSQARLVDQESGETAELLISLQHYQAEDRATSDSVSSESNFQDCKKTSIPNGSNDDGGVDFSSVGNGGSQDNASNAVDSAKEETAREELAKEQLTNYNFEDKIGTISEQPAVVGSVCNSLSSPVFNSEKNIDAADKVDNSVQPNGEENILEFEVESSECKEQNTNRAKKSDIKSELPEESEPKRKRRNDVWLSRIQDADFGKFMDI